MARNWMRTLRPASFRGVPFWVETDETDGVGRRVALHEISGGDAHLTEDMGAATRVAYVEAYVAGDIADAAGLALEAACAAPGPSMLTLPIDPPRSMHCLACRRNRHRDRGGHIAYDLEFLLAGSGGQAAPSGIGQMRGAFAAGLSVAAAAIRRVLP